MIEQKKKARSEYVREELAKTFEAPAAEIVERLGNLGINVTKQDVYAQRNMMRTRKAVHRRKATLTLKSNAHSLSHYVTKILNNNLNGLDGHALSKIIKSEGYKTHSSDFIQVLRKRLYEMVDIGVLNKHGAIYTIAEKYKGQIIDTLAPKILGSSTKPESKQTVPAVSANPVPAAAKLIKQLPEVDNFGLLCQAVIAYAKAKGLENAEDIPQLLIDNRKDYLASQEAIIKQREIIAEAEQKASELNKAGIELFASVIE